MAYNAQGYKKPRLLLLLLLLSLLLLLLLLLKVLSEKNYIQGTLQVLLVLRIEGVVNASTYKINGLLAERMQAFSEQYTIPRLHVCVANEAVKFILVGSEWLLCCLQQIKEVNFSFFQRLLSLLLFALVRNK